MAHFEQAVQPYEPAQVADAVPCGPDLEPVLASARKAVEAGVDHLYFHQIGDPTDGFIDLWRRELRPELVASSDR